MLQLPTARREMLVIARSPALYRARLSGSLALLVLGVGVAVLYHNAGVRALGAALQTLAFILLTICLFVGVQLTCDSIAREKREGTIGLLFLTHLSAFQIVTGKLIANGLMGLYWLLIAVPLLSLLLIVGGLEGLQFAVVAFSAVNILFFSASIGLFVSARHTDRKKAATRATWIVLFFWWGMPILTEIAGRLNLPVWIGYVIGLFSVSGAYNSPFAGPRVRLISSPWMNLLATHLLGWVFLGLATFYLRRRWQDQPAPAGFSLREWWRNLSLGKPSARIGLRRTLLDKNPFTWLACRERFRGLPIWIATLSIAAFAVYVGPTLLAASGLGISLAIGLSIFHRAMMAATSAHQLQAEQEQGTLEMLVSTPLTVQDIIRGQLLASFRQFRGPAAFVLLLYSAMAVYLILRPQQRDHALLLAGLGLAAASYLFDLYCLAWAGMWGAVKVRDARNATGSAMLRIVVIPVLVFGWTVAAALLARWYFGLVFTLPPWALVAFWAALSLTNNLTWLALIRRRLPEELRTFASRRFSQGDERTLGGWVGRTLGRVWGRARQNRVRARVAQNSP